MAPKVTIRHEPADETPSQGIINNVNAVHVVTDANGRQIGIRKLKALDRLRMFEVLGPENAKNEPYLGYAALAFHVCSINTETIHRPTTKTQLEGLIQQLGDEGMNAVAAYFDDAGKGEEEKPKAIEQIKN